MKGSHVPSQEKIRKGNFWQNKSMQRKNTELVKNWEKMCTREKQINIDIHII